jgi:hypothetical protein
MFRNSPDERLSAWTEFRQALDTSIFPLLELAEFWGKAPYIPYNKNVDPYNEYSWPTPWEIIVENKYDDFTKALMMSWTLKLTDKFKNSLIEIKTYTDSERQKQYNMVFIDNKDVVNYLDNEVVKAEDIPDSFQLDFLVEVKRPR